MSSKIFYEVITKDNLLHMAQSISVAALKKASCQNQRYQNMYRRLLDDIHTPSIDRPLIQVPYETLRIKIKKILPAHILYDLRTTFYTRLKECGIADNAINEYVGHSLGALGNAYTDLSDEYLLKEGEKFKY